MRFVLDTNVLISSTLWDGSSAQKLLFKLIKTNAKIFTSIQILEEYRLVLEKEFDYSHEEAMVLVEKILLFAKLVNPKQKVNVVKEDPSDNKIVECALASLAEYIVTYDKHLLKIKEYTGIKICRPEDLHI